MDGTRNYALKLETPSLHALTLKKMAINLDAQMSSMLMKCGAPTTSEDCNQSEREEATSRENSTTNKLLTRSTAKELLLIRASGFNHEIIYC